VNTLIEVTREAPTGWRRRIRRVPLAAPDRDEGQQQRMLLQARRVGSLTTGNCGSRGATGGGLTVGRRGAAMPPTPPPVRRRRATTDHAIVEGSQLAREAVMRLC
jgi:hypothetical protein